MVEGTALEMRHRVTPIGGSNPPASAEEIVYNRSMGNVLDLKKNSHDSREEVRPSADGIVGSPVPERHEPEGDGGLSEASAYLKSLHEPVLAEETAWNMHTVPDEFERKKEHALLATLAAIGIGVAIWSGSIALVAIVALTIFAWEAHHRTHHEVNVHMGAKGVTINGHRHPYEALTSFHLQHLPDDSHHLSIKPAGRFRPNIRLPLGNHNHEEVRAVLSQHIAEDEHPVPISELFLKS